MLNILIDDLTTSIEVEAIEYQIYTDFRDWIELQQMFADNANEDKIMNYILDLFVDDIPENIKMAIPNIIKFMRCNSDTKKEGSQANRKSKYVFSFSYDADYILGGFMECYGIDLSLIEYMHWWKFNSLLNALNENCGLKQRIAYRSIDISSISNKQEKKRIQKIQQRIAIPVPELEDEDIASAFD